MSIFDETSLDQLHQLTAKRLAAIHQGEDFTLSNSEKTFKGVIAQDRKSITFDPATPAHPGAQFEHKGGSFIVLAVADRAGCKCADVAEVIGNVAVYQKSAVRGPGGMVVKLSQVAEALPVLKKEGSSITTLLRYGNLRGAVLKTSSGFMEVIGAFLRGAVAELQLTPYREPEQKSVQRTQARPDYLDRAPSKAPWSSSDSFRGW